MDFDNGDFDDDYNQTAAGMGVVGLVILVLLGWWAYSAWFSSSDTYTGISTTILEIMNQTGLNRGSSH